MPGPALVISPVVRGDSQSVPRRDANPDEQRIPLADLTRTSIGLTSPRADLQGTTMQEALQRAASNPLQDPRLIPNQHQNARTVAVASYMPVNEDLLLTAQRAKIVEALKERAEEARHAEVAKVEATAQTEAAAHRSAAKLRAAAREEQEISVALKDRSPVRGSEESRAQTEVPRMVEKDAEHSTVAKKDRSINQVASREETIEAKLAKESDTKVVGSEARSEMPQSAKAPSSVESLVAEARQEGAHQSSSTPKETLVTTTEERMVSVSDSRESLPVAVAQIAAPEVTITSSKADASRQALPEGSSESVRANETPLTEEDQVLAAEAEEVVSQAPRKTTRRTTKRKDARMRYLLLQQLMDQRTTKVRREKILKALITLGISEVEYRKLLLKLGEMDAARLAEQVAARSKVAEPIAMTVEAPAMKDTTAAAPDRDETPRVESKGQTTRAALYRQLREEATATRK